VAQRARERDEQPQRESARKCRERQGTVKDLNENLAPLWRYLARAVGRPWTKIYAEISEHNCKRSAVGAHIYQHLMARVILHPLYIDGRAHDPSWGREIRTDSYYVDRHGILRRGTAPTFKQAQRRAPKPAKYVPLAEGAVAKQDAEGRWYAVTLRPLEPSASGTPVWDVWRRGYVYRGAYDAQQEYGDAAVVAIAKRALNTREIAEIKAR
jgi:hypothetical protein